MFANDVCAITAVTVALLHCCFTNPLQSWSLLSFADNIIAVAVVTVALLPCCYSCYC